MSWEASFLLWIQENVRSDAWTPIVTFITHLGDHGAFWIILTIACLLWKKTRTPGILMAISLACNYLVNNILLKNLVARIRPYEAVEGLNRIIEAQSDFSFPSGHSGSSFAVAVVILLVCPRKYGIPAIILATLIALSRLYVGVHYPTDVLAGVAIATVIAVIVCTVYKKKFLKEA